MKFCSHCGSEIEDQAVICVKCGCAVTPYSNEPDVPVKNLNILSFLLPIIGLVFYILYHEKSPNKAAAILKWTIIGLIVGAIGGYICIFGNL